MDISEAFGRAVKARRAELGVKQDALADKAGMSRPHLSGIERGAHEAGVRVVFNLAQALECLPSDLWLTAERLIESAREA